MGEKDPKGVKLKTIPTNRPLIHEFIFYPFGNEVIIKTLKAKSILVYVSNPTLCHSANTPSDSHCILQSSQHSDAVSLSVYMCVYVCSTFVL